MNLKKVLSPSLMYPNLEASDKETAIRRMVAFLVAANGLPNEEELAAAVLERERRDSTGLEHGIAIPHGKTDAVTELIAGIARVPAGVDFGSRDGVPATILVMTISPQNRSGPHLQFIGEVVRLLRDHDHREAVRRAPDARAMFEAIVR